MDTSTGKVIAYQGYMDKQFLGAIEYRDGGVDPEDGSYFSIMMTPNRKRFQMM
jgi:hypothetical protein